MKFIPKILIVDDSTVVRQNIIETLKSEKMEFIEAVDGYAAMEILENAEERMENIDLMICDINMPGISGLEVITEKNNIKNYLPYIPVLMITSSNTGEIISEIWKLNVTDILFKPFTSKDLLSKVLSIISTLVNADELIKSSKNSTLIISSSVFQSSFFKKTLEQQVGIQKVDIVNNFSDAWMHIVSSSRKPYDLIFTDWQINEDDCQKFTEKIRNKEDYKNVPVCITMSTLDPAKLNSIANIPLSSVIYKNIAKEDLIFKIKYLFNLKNSYISK
ncbi:MAG: response regulator [Oligoflexia bacterium]|nr:response regulator [Oligoflexia bacterium]